MEPACCGNTPHSDWCFGQTIGAGMGRKLVGSRRVPSLMEDILLLDCRKADKQLEDSTDLILHRGITATSHLIVFLAIA